MIAEDAKKATWLIVGGMLGGVASIALAVAMGSASSSEAGAAAAGLVFLVLRLAAFAAYMTGCVFYARAKGHSPALGAVGLIGIIGLIILAVIPDKTNER